MHDRNKLALLFLVTSKIFKGKFQNKKSKK